MNHVYATWDYYQKFVLLEAAFINLRLFYTAIQKKFDESLSTDGNIRNFIAINYFKPNKIDINFWVPLLLVKILHLTVIIFFRVIQKADILNCVHIVLR